MKHLKSSLFALLFLIPTVHAQNTPEALEEAKSIVEYDDEYEVIESSTLESAGQEEQLSTSAIDPTRAKVVAVINKSAIGSSAQTMKVYVDGILKYQWLVSTGREQTEKAASGRIYKSITPVGYFRPTSVEKNHYSKTWKADMPHAVFFIGGIAIHESAHTELFGKRASGGCVRASKTNAKIFYDLVKDAGRKKVAVINRDGSTATNTDGTAAEYKAYDVLIIVENRI